METNHLTRIRFTELGLQEPLLKGLETTGFSHCTPIQAQALPLALAGKDVAGQAQTGTGKTAAFLLAIMNRLLTRPASPERRANQPRAIVLSPTRELAVQIHKDALQLGEFTGFSIGVVYGGLDYDKQRTMVQSGVDLLIGTPGRLIDYHRQRALDLHAVEVVVLDEADRMFDLGFIKDIRYLLRRMPSPERRLNMLFSATLSFRVQELAYEHMNNPQLVEIEPDKVTADAVTQSLYHVERRQKMALLIGLLRKLEPSRALIFVNTKRAAEAITASLTANGFHAGALSGDVPQKKRLSLISRIAKGELPILVATDVAARGLHIPEVSHVINFDLPQNEEDYVHRIGRTARAGASGEAISLACEEYVYSLMEIEAYIGHKIPVAPVTDDLLVALAPTAQPRRRHSSPQKRRGPPPSRKASAVSSP
jgi:ATP-dependent RNA helicase RhlB